MIKEMIAKAASTFVLVLVLFCSFGKGSSWVDDDSIAVKSAVDDTIVDVSDAPFTIMDATEIEAQ